MRDLTEVKYIIQLVNDGQLNLASLLIEFSAISNSERNAFKLLIDSLSE